MTETTYDFGVPQHRKLLVGFGFDRISGLLVAGLAAVAAFLAGFGVAPIVACLLGGLAWGFLPYRGRLLHEWSPAAARHLAQRATRRDTFRAPVPLPRLRTGRPAASLALPPELEGITWETHDAGGVSMGVAAESRRSGSSLTAVFAVDGYHRFVLAEPAEQARAISAWGEILGATAVERSRISRLQWVERAIPDTGRDQQDWMASHRPPVDTPEMLDYEQLLLSATMGARRHEVFLAAQVTSPARDRSRALLDAAAEWRLLGQRLAQSGFRARPLGAGELSSLVRSWSDPAHAARMDAVGAYADLPGVRLGASTPRARRASWDHVRIDGCYHRTLRVVAWPRVPVGANWLEPLLVGPCPGAVRTVAMHLEPVPTSKASREASSALVRHDVDEEQRAKWGFTSTALHRREVDELARREEELASGFAEHRIACILGVSAPELATLDEATASLVQAATASRLEVEELWGYQDEGWASTLPLCRLRFKVL